MPRTTEFAFANLAMETTENSIADGIHTHTQQRVSQLASASAAAMPRPRNGSPAQPSQSRAASSAASEREQELAIRMAELEHRRKVLERKRADEEERKARFARVMGGAALPAAAPQSVAPRRASAPSAIASGFHPGQLQPSAPLAAGASFAGCSTPPSPPPPVNPVISSQTAFAPTPSLIDLFRKPARPASPPVQQQQPSVRGGFRAPRVMAPPSSPPPPSQAAQATSRRQVTSELFDVVALDSTVVNAEEIPGPAGNIWSTSEETPTKVRRVTAKPVGERSRYGHQGVFCKGPWLALCTQFGLPPVLERDTEKRSLLARFNVDAIVREGLGARQKVEFLAVVVVKLRSLDEGAVAVLADPTGTMEAEVTQTLLKAEGNAFAEGCAVALRDVAVFRSLVPVQGVASHSLIITSANVDKVFGVDEPVPSCFTPSQLDDIAQGQTKPAARTTLADVEVVVVDNVAPAPPDRPFPSTLPAPAQQGLVHRAPQPFPPMGFGRGDDDDDEEEELPEEVIAIMEGRAPKRARAADVVDLTSQRSSEASQRMEASQPSMPPPPLPSRASGRFVLDDDDDAWLNSQSLPVVARAQPAAPLQPVVGMTTTTTTTAAVRVGANLDDDESWLADD